MPEKDGQSHETGRPRTNTEKRALERVHDIFVAFAHAVSAVKIFPSHHDTVLRLQDELFARLGRFLQDDRPFEFTIKEDAFIFEGQIVYRSDDIVKSLPYLFFKDGLHKLSFLPGLNRAELEIFLALIRRVSLLPADVGDIVDALWQKDLAHIRYYAPHDFLESKITSGKGMPLDFTADRNLLSEGQIVLAPEDAEDVSRFGQKGRVEERPAEYGESQTIETDGDEEAGRLRLLLESERSIPAEKDFLDTIFEILLLEDNLGAFAETLSFLELFSNKMIRRGHFSTIVLLWREMDAFSSVFQAVHKAKGEAIEVLRRKLRGQVSFDLLREVAGQGLIWDAESFFAYLNLIGSSSLPLAAELVEALDDRDFRAASLPFFVRIGRSDPGLLTAFADENKSSLTLILISALAKIGDPRGLPYLLGSRACSRSEIRIAAIRALRVFPQEEARTALLESLADPEESVRMEAARSLRNVCDPSLLHPLFRVVSGRAFRTRSRAEKNLVLAVLGGIRDEEACAFLARLMKKRSLWRRARNSDTQLAAVQALESLGTPPAREALESGLRRGNATLANACRESLRRYADRAGRGKKSP